MNSRKLAGLLPALLALITYPAALADRPSTGDFRPDPASVQRYGPAYRYPQAGWIVLHVEGEPYERGYQHGKLLHSEIVAYLRCFAAQQSHKAPGDGWRHTRTLTNALFLRRFDKEYLEEMKGIADGASAAGARFDSRPLDLLDIAAINCWAEIETLPSALEATPTGLEGIRFKHAQPRAMPEPRPEHCSAFAATGPATADGKIVFGHITMFGLYPSYHYNVYLDLKPAKGQRMFMCSYPGGIQSGMDYYMNDAGLLICETTIAQTRFDAHGLSLGSRIRKAIQYADTIDKAVDILKADNNGLYTNEWLLGDVNTNEIAVFQLGTKKSKLSRSSKNEWFGGTQGFYWGCNNTKDLDLRLETLASVNGRPANVVFHPSERDRAWQRLYHKHKGKIGVEFGKEAFTTPPIAAFHSLDAKFTTTDLAKQLKTWALFGPPLGRTWQPTEDERQKYPEIKPLVSNPWTILHAAALPPAEKNAVVAVDLSDKVTETAKKENLLNVPAWHGTLLPASDADIWLATAFADYERIYSLEKSLRGGKKELSADDRDRIDVELNAYRSGYLAAARANGDVPLAKIRSAWDRDDGYRIASGKGVLLLHELRTQTGDARFEEVLDSFGRKHAGKRVTSTQFRNHIDKAVGKPLNGFFESWLNQSGLPGQQSAAAFSVLSFHDELQHALIVHGTGDESAANREAADALQKAIREKWSNFTVPIKSDRNVTPAELKTHHLLLIGRPDANVLVERLRTTLPVEFGQRSFIVRKQAYAHPLSTVIVAADNPFNHRYSAVVLAGLSAEATYHAAAALLRHGRRGANVVVLPHGGSAKVLALAGRNATVSLGK